MASVSNTGTIGNDLLNQLNGTKKTTTKTDDNSAVSQSNFLTMLTTQLQNQDPMNPLDNSQMTSQLAQISTVDGITQLNTTMQSMLAASQSSETMQAANLVGRAVLIEGSQLQMAQGAALGGVELSQPADNVKVQIKDNGGNVIRTLDLGAMDAGSQAFGWDGKTDEGVAAADGTYSVSVSAVRGDTKVDVTALQLGTVSGVIRAANGVKIEVGGLGLHTMDDIKQILS
ncbi:flagellar hook assembly protein FlgD [Niveibacterium sp. SC-1]|uniref:flagellar hook assembly protein FlgD n=1 Tax=Niveibacterium sp. SC-1 TaxID=3135646 RepID=UPI00311D7C63